MKWTSRSNFFNDYDFLHHTQSGFLSKHSTETALTFMTENWLKADNGGKIVGTIMVGFRKAFDLVDHALLLETLSYYKCSENFITLMKSYLANKTQVVSVNSKLSNVAEINCGVPQGSILGPLLFWVFNNDVPLMLSDKIYSTELYADGTPIYDMQDNPETLQRNLQHSLVSLQIWCKRNGMLLNTDKTKIMLITTRQQRVRLDENLFTLIYNDVILQLTTGDKILGVNIEQNILWNNHFQCVSRKVSSYIWLLSKIK